MGTYYKYRCIIQNIDKLLLKIKYFVKYRILEAIQWYICSHDSKNIFEYILILVKYTERPYYFLNQALSCFAIISILYCIR